MSASATRARFLLVSGYVRELIDQHQINDIIYSYQRSFEEWTRNYTANNVVIDEQNALITVENDESMTILGSHIVSEGQYEWKIKMVKSYEGWPCIGIVEDDKHYLDKLFSKEGNKWWHQRGYEWSGIWKEEGQILNMMLDLDQGTLSFKVDGVDYGVPFNNVSQKGYRLAFGTVGSKGSKFLLLDS